MTIQLGTVIHGTLRPQDLLRAFSRALTQFEPLTPKDLELTWDAYEWAQRIDKSTEYPDDNRTAEEIIYELSERLNELAPAGTYFGTLEGDGSDFGFWEIDQ